MERAFPPKRDRSIERNEAVYGDTDMNPNEEDQRDVHHGSEIDDEIDDNEIDDDPNNTKE